MTTLKVNVVRRPSIKVKVLPNFPSSVTVTSPILLSRVGGNYAFSFDATAFTSTLTSLYQPQDQDLTAISALSSTGIARRTGAGTWSVGTAVSNAELATMAAFTFKGNNTSGSATPTDVDIAALTTKASPAAGDFAIISDQAASGAWKKATVSSLGGVSSIAGNIGAFTLGAGLTNSTNVLLVDPTYMRGYISGLTLSVDGVSPNTVIDVAAGVATSDDVTTMMKLSSAFTKNMNSTWVVGTGNGCADGAASYTTLGASTWYHLFQIERTDTGVVDILASKSATAPTLPTNYTKQRRIGSVKTDGSSHIIKFFQAGFDFFWDVPVNDVTTNNPGTSAILSTLTVPTGVSVRAKFWFYLQSAENARRTALITSPLQTDTAPSAGTMSSAAAGVGVANSGIVQAEYQVWTNTSSQIRYRMDGSTANTAVFIDTAGWTDAL